MTFGLALGFPVSEVLEVLQPLGAHSLTFFPILPYLNAFLRWRLASWPWGFPVSEVLPVLQPLGARLWGLTVSLSSLFFPILMHSLGDVWHPGPGVPCFGGFGGFCSLWGLTVSQPAKPPKQGTPGPGCQTSPKECSKIGKNREESETVSPQRRAPKGCKTCKTSETGNPRARMPNVT